MALTKDTTQNNTAYLYTLLASNEIYGVQQHCVWLQFCLACVDICIAQNIVSGYRIVPGN